MSKTPKKTKKPPEPERIDFLKLSLYIFKIFSTVLVGFYKILVFLLKTYKIGKERKDLKTYIRLRERYINIAVSDEGYKKDMMIVNGADFKPLTIVDMRDKALERFIRRTYNNYPHTKKA